MSTNHVSSKQDAVRVLETQVARGEQLLAMAIDTYEALTMANADRGVWSLTNKKLLYTLLGDSALLMRGSGPLEDGLVGRSRLDEDVAHFRRTVRDQLAVLERVQLLLLKMA